MLPRRTCIAACSKSVRALPEGSSVWPIRAILCALLHWPEMSTNATAISPNIDSRAKISSSSTPRRAGTGLAQRREGEKEDEEWEGEEISRLHKIVLASMYLKEKRSVALRSALWREFFVRNKAKHTLNSFRSLHPCSNPLPARLRSIFASWGLTQRRRGEEKKREKKTMGVVHLGYSIHVSRFFPFPFLRLCAFA